MEFRVMVVVTESKAKVLLAARSCTARESQSSVGEDDSEESHSK